MPHVVLVRTLYNMSMWYIVRLDSSRVATLVKVRSATRVSSNDPTRVKSNYIPVYTTILRQIERCHYWGRQSCRPLNRVPSLPSLMVLRLTPPPRYVALWVENPFSRTSARTTYRLGEANFHTSLEEEGIFSSSCCLNIYYRVFIM